MPDLCSRHIEPDQRASQNSQGSTAGPPMISESKPIKTTPNISPVETSLSFSLGYAFSPPSEPSKPVGRNIKHQHKNQKHPCVCPTHRKKLSLKAEMMPIRMPPSAAPRMLPMPPSTAAVNERKPAVKPIVNTAVPL